MKLDVNPTLITRFPSASKPSTSTRARSTICVFADARPKGRYNAAITGRRQRFKHEEMNESYPKCPALPCTFLAPTKLHAHRPDLKGLSIHRMRCRTEGVTWLLSEMWGEDRIVRAASSRTLPVATHPLLEWWSHAEFNACHRDAELQISRFRDEDGASNLVLW